MAAPLYTTDSGRLFHAGQILIPVVGLPARGKTHISRSLERYLRWLGVRTKVFSLGDYRRAVLGGTEALPADYFVQEGPRQSSTEQLRQQIKNGLEQNVIEWFQRDNGQVAIYDANNGTIQLRSELREKFAPLGINLMFLESVCDRDDIIEANIKAQVLLLLSFNSSNVRVIASTRVKLSSPDYKGWNPEDALQDYWKRIRQHEKAYQTIEQPSFPYVKIINVGDRIVVNNIQGYLQSRIVFFLMNIHNHSRTIWLARSGRSTIEHSYRADSGLSGEGIEYAEQLRTFIVSKRKEILHRKRQNDPNARAKPLTVWTSSRRRCVETTKPFFEVGFRVAQFTQMSEINPGVIDGMTTEEIQAVYPEEYERSLKDAFSHRYPRAESYHDLSVRLEPVIFNLERHQHDLLIISHASVLRCLFSYLKGLSPHEIPKIDIQRGDCIEIAPTAYGIISRTHHFYEDPSQKHLGPEAYVYGSPASAQTFDDRALTIPPRLSMASIKRELEETPLQSTDSDTSGTDFVPGV